MQELQTVTSLVISNTCRYVQKSLYKSSRCRRDAVAVVQLNCIGVSNVCGNRRKSHPYCCYCHFYLEWSRYHFNFRARKSLHKLVCISMFLECSFWTLYKCYITRYFRSRTRVVQIEHHIKYLFTSGNNLFTTCDMSPRGKVADTALW